MHGVEVVRVGQRLQRLHARGEGERGQEGQGGEGADDADARPPERRLEAAVAVALELARRGSEHQHQKVVHALFKGQE